MGGCASKPKTLKTSSRKAAAPTKAPAPVVPEKLELETTTAAPQAEEVPEAKPEQPSVDLSELAPEPKEEAKEVAPIPVPAPAPKEETQEAAPAPTVETKLVFEPEAPPKVVEEKGENEADQKAKVQKPEAPMKGVEEVKKEEDQKMEEAPAKAKAVEEKKGAQETVA